jgi:integrase
MLLRERDKLLRVRAGIPDGADVDLSLVRLPGGALMFPNVPGACEEFSFTTSRNPRNSKEFARRAKLLGFSGFRFHHLRGTHATLLLDRGVPVHVVAERIGDDPAVLLRNYAKRKRKNTANNSVAAVIRCARGGISRRLIEPT